MTKYEYIIIEGRGSGEAITMLNQYATEGWYFKEVIANGTIKQWLLERPVNHPSKTIEVTIN